MTTQSHGDALAWRKATPAASIHSFVVVWPMINAAPRIPRNRKYTVELMGLFENERDANLAGTSPPRKERRKEETGLFVTHWPKNGWLLD